MSTEQGVLFWETYVGHWIPLSHREPDPRPQWCAVVHLGWDQEDEISRQWHPSLEPWVNFFVWAPGTWMFPFCMCEEEFTHWYPLPDLPDIT